MAGERGWNFVHPFEDPKVIAGQGSIGVELMDVKPDVVVIPIGGGGLISGLGLYLQSQNVRVVGAQILNVDNMARSLSNRPLLPSYPPTLGDGVRVLSISPLTHSIIKRVCKEIILVTEKEVRQAVRDLALHEKVVVEGAGAVAVAALGRVEGVRKVAVVSGGNIDMGVFAGVLG
jgi:threonine dehydratase